MWTALQDPHTFANITPSGLLLKHSYNGVERLTYIPMSSEHAASWIAFNKATPKP
jgi:hypothetical protein